MTPNTYTYWLLYREDAKNLLRPGAHVIERDGQGTPCKTYRLMAVENGSGALVHREVTDAKDLEFTRKLDALNVYAARVYPDSQESVAMSSTHDREGTALILLDHHDVEPFQCLNLVACAIYRHGLGAFLDTLAQRGRKEKVTR